MLTKALLLNILLCVIEIRGENYCSHNICRNNKQLCKFQQSHAPARHCMEFQELLKTEDDKKAILDKINSRRNKVAAGELRSYPAADNMMKLEWSTNLEQSAQRWANQCVKNSSPDIKDACRDLEGVSVGQNIATVYGESPGLLATALVDVWYMELLNNNASILPRFRKSSETGPQYDNFSQLVWAESSSVGCSGVNFKERLHDRDSAKNRTVYRLVCNFFPSGNRENQSVYTFGIPCTRCPNGTTCDIKYNALCSKPATKDRYNLFNKTEEVLQPDSHDDLILVDTDTTQTDKVENTSIFDKETDLENFTLFDYFSHLHEYTRQIVTVTSTPKPECKDVLAVDEFINLLKRKLSNDHIFKELLLASKTTQSLPDTNFTDASVAAFINRIYSKKVPLTTTNTPENQLLNSTLLVDLVEAVIFRSGDKTPVRLIEEQSTHAMSYVNPIKVQAELAEVKENEDFTGHYFFPEDDEDINTTETTEYYDVTNPSIADVLSEIEDIKKNAITKSFLDDILESESSDFSTERTTTVIFLSPDNMNAYKNGHEVMKKFLEDIKEKSD